MISLKIVAHCIPGVLNIMFDRVTADHRSMHCKLTYHSIYFWFWTGRADSLEI